MALKREEEIIIPSIDIYDKIKKRRGNNYSEYRSAKLKRGRPFV